MQYLCPACDNPSHEIDTVIRVETTTRTLNNENGVAWLGLSPHSDIFQGKSAFKLMQAHTLAIFNYNPPQADVLPKLTLNSKAIHDPVEALAQVERRVGKGEVELGICALCFEEMSRTYPLAACGRSGCSQRVDESCLRHWVSSLALFVSHNN
jgi:hypothetical protein